MFYYDYYFPDLDIMYLPIDKEPRHMLDKLLYAPAPGWHGCDRREDKPHHIRSPTG